MFHHRPQRKPQAHVHREWIGAQTRGARWGPILRDLCLPRPPRPLNKPLPSVCSRVLSPWTAMTVPGHRCSLLPRAIQASLIQICASVCPTQREADPPGGLPHPPIQPAGWGNNRPASPPRDKEEEEEEATFRAQSWGPQPSAASRQQVLEHTSGQPSSDYDSTARGVPDQWDIRQHAPAQTPREPHPADHWSFHEWLEWLQHGFIQL